MVLILFFPRSSDFLKKDTGNLFRLVFILCFEERITDDLCCYVRTRTIFEWRKCLPICYNVSDRQRQTHGSQKRKTAK